jgi:hypothetical protein
LIGKTGVRRLDARFASLSSNPLNDGPEEVGRGQHVLSEHQLDDVLSLRPLPHLLLTHAPLS